MRTTFILTLILLVAAFAVAQQPTAPSAPAGNSQTQTQSQQPETTPGQAPSAGMPARGDIVEGCLGGSNPNYTLTDKAGTTFQLIMPEGSDASSLASHIGESVQVQGTSDKSGSAKSSSDASAGAAASAAGAGAASGGQTIRVSKIGRGTGTCPAGSNAKPPSK